MRTPPSLAPVDPNPARARAALPGAFRPQAPAFFLTAMQRSLRASPYAALHLIPGTLTHRLLYLAAEALSRLSHSFAQGADAAAREGTYRAWMDPVLFPPRFPATFARGTVRVSFAGALQTPVAVPEGTLFGTLDGRVLRSVAALTVPAGLSEGFVPVVSELAGPAGNVEAGSVTRLISPLNLPAAASNPQAILGGRDEESDAAIHARFQVFVASRATANRQALLSAARNAVVGEAGRAEAVSDAVLVLPWLLPGGGEMGLGFVVVDSGAGGASPELVARAQFGLDMVEATGQKHRVIPADAWVIPGRASVLLRSGADVQAASRALRATCTSVLGASLIEDGFGRGVIRVADLKEALDAAHPGVVEVSLDLGGALTPPLGARVVPGTLSLDVVERESWRL